MRVMGGPSIPLHQDFNQSYGLPPPSKAQQQMQKDMTKLVKAMLHITGPPMVFLCVTSLFSFRWHFQLSSGIWFLVALFFIPAYVAYGTLCWAVTYRQNASWPRLGVFLFFGAAVAGSALGQYNYWYHSQPAYALEGMRKYTEIDASVTSGQRVMDASEIHFKKGSRIVTDLAMSYTEWDTYCVAPITSRPGMTPEDAGLASYDFWAVGVNCCSPGQQNFHCGEYSNPNAHAGLRVTMNELLPSFDLALQQAEASYNLRRGHPIFVYFVQDPDGELANFFSIALKNWIVWNIMHFGLNFACVMAFTVLFAGSIKDTGLAVLDE